jgi:hypothetical protein
MASQYYLSNCHHFNHILYLLQLRSIVQIARGTGVNQPKDLVKEELRTDKTKMGYKYLNTAADLLLHE